MKENTILLPLQDYNDLRDFKKTYENDGLICKYNYTTQYITRDAALIKLRDELKEADDKIAKLYDRIADLKKSRKPWWKF